MQGEIVGKPIKKEGFIWIKLKYEDGKTGWVQENFLIREYFYSIEKDNQSLFLQEKISLAGTEKNICTTS